jgi:hypothetical protein
MTNAACNITLLADAIGKDADRCTLEACAPY